MSTFNRVCFASAFVIASMSAVQSHAAGMTSVPLVAPVGISLQDSEVYPSQGGGRRGRGQEAKVPEGMPKTAGFFNGGGMDRGSSQYLADEQGRYLYVFEDDVTPGKSACVDACAEQWIPAQPLKGAQAGGQWSIITRPDKTKQWAYRGKPLHRFVGDVPGELVGLKSGAPKWKTVKLDIAGDIKRPPGIGVTEARFGGGYVLTDRVGFTLYAANEKAKAIKACVTADCLDQWKPVVAPAAASPVGDFTLASRSDGLMQWVYKGQPLFTFTGDLMQGDVFGIAKDPNIQATMIARHWMPPEADIKFDPARGPIVAKDKFTLYRFDVSFHAQTGHGIPGSTAGSPKVGKTLGTGACNDECLKEWKPYVAAPGAVSTGHWELMTRQNGVRQWSYRGFAAYTYAGDKSPLDRAGSDNYKVMVADDINQDVYDDTSEYGRPLIRGTNGPAAYTAYIEP